MLKKLKKAIKKKFNYGYSSSNWEESYFGGFYGVIWDHPDVTIPFEVDIEVKDGQKLPFYTSNKLMKIFLLKVKEHKLTGQLLKGAKVEVKERFFSKEHIAVISQASLQIVLQKVCSLSKEHANLFDHYYTLITTARVSMPIKPEKSSHVSGTVKHGNGDTENEDKKEKDKKDKKGQDQNSEEEQDESSEGQDGEGKDKKDKKDQKDQDESGNGDSGEDEDSDSDEDSKEKGDKSKEGEGEENDDSDESSEGDSQKGSDGEEGEEEESEDGEGGEGMDGEAEEDGDEGESGAGESGGSQVNALGEIVGKPEQKKGELSQKEIYDAIREFEDLLEAIVERFTPTRYISQNFREHSKTVSAKENLKTTFTEDEISMAGRLVKMLDITFDPAQDRINSLRTGKLDVRKLAEVIPGNTNVYYVVEEQQTTKPFSICILQDQSGSMNGPKIAFSKQLLKTLYLAFSDIIPDDKFYVYGHNGENAPQLHVYQDKYNAKFEDRIESVYAGGGNYDGPAIEMVYDKVRQMTDDNIIFIVLSDGAPCGQSACGGPASIDMKKILERARRDGFVTVGIGIMHFNDPDLYNYQCVVHSLDGDAMKKVSHIINKVVKTEFQ